MTRSFAGQGVDSSQTGSYPSAPTLLQMNPTLSAKSAEWQISKVCPICRSRSIREFAVIRHFRHSRCSDCGLTFVNPVPPPQILHDFYNSSFYSNYRQAENDRADADAYYMISMYADKHSLAK